MVGVAQRLLIQRFVGSQQSAGDLHGSATNEQVLAGGGTHCNDGIDRRGSSLNKQARRHCTSSAQTPQAVKEDAFSLIEE